MIEKTMEKGLGRAIPLLRGVEGCVTGISTNTPPPQHIPTRPLSRGELL